MTRQRLIQQIQKLRRAGWEKPILPYGMPFDELSASDESLYLHLRKIRLYRKQELHERIRLTVQLIIILTIIFIAIFR